jgi:hypothetical protein
MWLHLLFLVRRRAWLYAGTLAAFTACLLTHESSATLLPMMVALEMTVIAERQTPRDAEPTSRRALRYLPFAVLLCASLAVAFVVNSRSYLILEGHYRLGWHAIPHALQYVVSLYVGPGIVGSYAAVAIVAGLLLWRGTARTRLFVAWMFVTIAPASFFTWGNVSRYLYLPAAGFALLLAEAIGQAETVAAARIPRRVARALAVAIACAIAVRFAVFAGRGATLFRERTRPYLRLAAAMKAANPVVESGASALVDAADVAGIPSLYWNAVASTIYCRPDIRLVVR